MTRARSTDGRERDDGYADRPMTSGVPAGLLIVVTPPKFRLTRGSRVRLRQTPGIDELPRFRLAASPAEMQPRRGPARADSLFASCKPLFALQSSEYRSTDPPIGLKIESARLQDSVRMPSRGEVRSNTGMWPRSRTPPATTSPMHQESSRGKVSTFHRNPVDSTGAR